MVVLIDADSTQMVEYVYDAWGNPISKTGTMAATLGTVNPFRYRGYVYDEETRLYYLRSRYYNPVWKRFVNADHIGERNLFLYCRNSPVFRVDNNGNKSNTCNYPLFQGEFGDKMERVSNFSKLQRRTNACRSLHYIASTNGLRKVAVLA